MSVKSRTAGIGSTRDPTRMFWKFSCGLRSGRSTYKNYRSRDTPGMFPAPNKGQHADGMPPADIARSHVASDLGTEQLQIGSGRREPLELGSGMSFAVIAVPRSLT